MKYELKQWINQVKPVFGSQPFAIRDLPEELQLTGELIHLKEHSVIKKAGQRYIPEYRKYVNLWVFL